MIDTDHYSQYNQGCALHKTDHHAQITAITGGKGGIGKTSISINLSLALAELDHKVLLFDADLELANVDVLLNIPVSKTLNHALKHNTSLTEILLNGPRGIKIITAGSGTKGLPTLTKIEYEKLIREFNELANHFDHFIIDTASGISEDVIIFSLAANQIIIVICDDPASITDAYALIKTLTQNYQHLKFYVIVNMVESYTQGHTLFHKLNQSTERFLNTSLELCGIIPFDHLLKKSVQNQQAIIEAYPSSIASHAIKRLAHIIHQWPKIKINRGHIRFFWEKILSYTEETQGL